MRATLQALLIFALFAALLTGVGPVRAGERLETPMIGESERDVVRRFGSPNGQLTSGTRKVLTYPGLSVVLQNGKVSSSLRTPLPSPYTAEPTTTNAPAAAAPSNDVTRLVDTLRTADGLELAKAIRACTGQRAAPAVPLLVQRLSDPTRLRLTTWDGEDERHRTLDMGMLAAQALALIGPEAWDPCMRTLRSGTLFAKARAAHALFPIFTQYRAKDPAFPDLLASTFNTALASHTPETAAELRTLVPIIAQIKTPKATKALNRALRHPDINLQKAVIVQLGERKDPSSIPGLAEIFLNDTNLNVREEAGKALQQFASPEAGRAVLEGTTRDDFFIRAQTARILGAAHDPSVSPFLFPLLKDSHADVRLAAADALGNIHDPSATLPLIDTLQATSDDALAQGVFKSLCPLVSNTCETAAFTALLPGLKQSDPKRRALFAELLGRTTLPESFEPLADLANDDPDETVRRVAVRFLGALDHPKRKDLFLTRILKDRSPAVRAEALRCVRFGPLRDNQEEILRTIVKKGSRDRRIEATLLLSDINRINRQPELLAILVDALPLKNQRISDLALDALCRQADIPPDSDLGRALGKTPSQWRDWWAKQGINLP